MSDNYVIQTYSGHRFNYKSPETSPIDIRDIARSLSFTVRFRGHIKWFYSVAQHCLEVSRRLPEEHRLSGILHDAAEFCYGDNPTPLKKFLPRLKLLEDSLLEQIFRQHNLHDFSHSSIVSETTVRSSPSPQFP